jgi:hypothetical protein
MYISYQMCVALQVVNHGVGEEVLQGFRDAAAEFFRLPEQAFPGRLRLRHVPQRRERHALLARLSQASVLPGGQADAPLAITARNV